MIPEPLKNKRFELIEKNIFGKSSVTDKILIDGYKEQDIFSAVEWLKEVLKETFEGMEEESHLHMILNNIDEAFEDVIKK